MFIKFNGNLYNFNQVFMVKKETFYCDDNAVNGYAIRLYDKDRSIISAQHYKADKKDAWEFDYRFLEEILLASR